MSFTQSIDEVSIYIGAPADRSCINARKTAIINARKTAISFIELLVEKQCQKIQAEEESELYRRRSDVNRHLMRILEENERYLEMSRNLIILAVFVLCGIATALVLFLSREGWNEQSLLRWKIMAVAVVSAGYWAVKFVTFVLSWPVKRWLRFRRYALYVIHGLKESVDAILYVCLLLVATHFWILPRLKIWVIPDDQVTYFLVALCIGSILGFMKNCYCLMLEAQLRYLNLFERIRLGIPYVHAAEIVNRRGSKSSNSKRQRDSLWIWTFEMKRESVPIWILRLLSKQYLDMLDKEFVSQYTIADKDIKDESKLVSLATQLFSEIKKGRMPNAKAGSDYRALRDFSGTLQTRKDRTRHLSMLTNILTYTFGDRMKMASSREDYTELKESSSIWETGLTWGDTEAFELDDEALEFIGRQLRCPKTIRTAKHDEKDAKDQEYPVRGSGRRGNGSSGTYQEYEHPRCRRVGYDPAEEIIPINKFLSLVIKGLKTSWYLKQNLDGSIKMFAKLNRALNAFVFLVVLISWLLLSKIISTGQIAVFFSPFLAASFIFGDSLKSIFQGLIFVFGMHPFGVGDVVIIGDKGKLRVTEVNILTSIFTNYETGEVVVIPNSTLITTDIINAGEEEKIPSFRDTLDFDLDPQTPLPDITDLVNNINTLLKGCNWLYHQKVVITPFEKVKMKVSYSYKDPTDYAEKRAQRKSRTSRMIMKLTKDMELINRGEYTRLFTVEIETRRINLDAIEDIEVAIMRCIQKGCRRYYRVTLVDLCYRKIKMGIYGGKEQEIRDAPDLNWEDIRKTLFVKKDNTTVLQFIVFDRHGNDVLSLSSPAKLWLHVKGAIPRIINGGPRKHRL